MTFLDKLNNNKANKNVFGNIMELKSVTKLIKERVTKEFEIHDIPNDENKLDRIQEATITSDQVQKVIVAS